jgi:hypothetical protein
MGTASGMNQGAYGAAVQKSYDQGNINSGYYGKQVGGPVSGSNQWYGKGNEYGMSLMAGDSDAFWTGYGDSHGMGPGNQMTSFLQGKYDTQALGNALYSKNAFTSDEGRMAGQSAIADAINKPGVQFFDPGVIIQNVLTAIASNNPERLMDQNPVLAQLIQGADGNPAGQVELIVGFLREALSATMPPDALDAFTGQLASIGDMFVRDLMKNPNNAQVGKMNFAQYLIGKMGPTLGL